MTVAAGVGGTTALGVMLGAGGGATAAGPGSVPAAGLSNQLASVPGQLAFTGASELALMIGVGLIALMAGILMLGLARHRSRLDLAAVSSP